MSSLNVSYKFFARTAGTSAEVSHKTLLNLGGTSNFSFATLPTLSTSFLGVDTGCLILYLTIINDAGEVETCVWRKSSNTGLMLNFSAACSKLWKNGLISCLLRCAKVISSNETAFNIEAEKL